MSNILVGLMFGLGAGAWVYDKTMRRTGGNTKNSLTTAGVAAVFGFIIAVTIMSIINSSLEN